VIHEADGQTMHFFDDTYLAELLQPWQRVALTHLAICKPQTTIIIKYVWRAVAIR
jgi:hypothetical protein